MASPSPSQSASSSPMPMPMSDDDMGGGMMMMMMQMYFSSKLPVTILFSNWVASDTPTYVGALFAVFLMGFFRHVLAWLRLEVRQANAAGAANPAALRQPLAAGLNGDGEAASEFKDSRKPRWWMRRYLRCNAVASSPLLLTLVDALLFYPTTLLGFLNMLIAMTYNPGLLLTLVAGETVGVAVLDGGRGSAEAAAASDPCC